MSNLKKLFEVIKDLHPEWEINMRKDGNYSLKSIDSKVFAYFTHEFGGVTINIRLYKTDSGLRKFSDFYTKSHRLNIGKWKDEVIDIRINNESDFNTYIQILELAYEKRKSYFKQNDETIKVKKINNSQISDFLPLKSEYISKNYSLN